MTVAAVAAFEPPDDGRIVEVVAQHTVLRSVGAGQLRGECPFCGSVMFRVRPRHGTFHCFGCGEAGDSRMFIAKIDLGS